VGPQGQPGLIWLGTWSGTATYAQGDAVEASGSSYVARGTTVLGVSPPGLGWELMARVGAEGPQGAPGPAGATGPQLPPGLDGAVGASGPTGPLGLTGAQGPSGATGPQGVAGLDGATGPTGPAGAVGAAGPSGTSLNPLQIALLRWYGGSRAGTSFATPVQPVSIAFDGWSMWVSCAGSVARLRAADGLVLGTYAVGGIVYGIAFDGASVWVANQTANTISKL
jgi:Collagen triple helix repeat (20 copies)